MSTDNNVQITISGRNVEELVDRFDLIAWHMGYRRKLTASESSPVVADGTYAEFPPSDDVGAKTAEAAVNEPIKRRPGRPRRSAATMDDAKGQEGESGEAELPPATLDDAKDAGRVVIHKGGVDALRGLLTEFGIGKIGELKKEAWPRFIARCHEVSQGDA